MATNPKKSKSLKDGDKKAAKKVESPPLEERKEETPQEPNDATSPAMVDTPVEEEPPPREPTPEPVYEEPVLTLLIVESYEGEKDKGLYEGDGAADFTGGHHYQGQFKEGLMHGKGRYTWADGVIYEGDFIRNKVTGKGVYRWPDTSLYQGDVYMGLRHGVGTFTCAGGHMSYTGEWCMGKRNGKGRMDYDEGVSSYDGDWLNNIRHGWGFRRYASGNDYHGLWFNNVRHGEGTMRWVDRDQIYTGEWEHGIQHGIGQHVWYLRRVAGSQYPLRNMYDGEFVRGFRHGYGTFYYANGARYEGMWHKNMKQGRGKFIFKNGRVFEGLFHKDNIVEFPDFEMDGLVTPDMSKIRTRTPLPSEQMSARSNDSRNTYSPSFLLDVERLLQHFPEADREEEAAQVNFVIRRHITNLRKVYSYYSGLGYEDSPDNTYIMSRMQFWRFLKDCKLHNRDVTLPEMDRVLAPVEEEQCDIHSPYGKILFREFLNHLVSLAFLIYQDEMEEVSPVLANCLSHLISFNILRHSCTVRGYLYHEPKRAVKALAYINQAYDAYNAFCSPRKYPPHEPTMKMRQFLLMLQDLKLVNCHLTAKAIIDVLASDDQNVADGEGAINLELQMSFLEFFEALIGCAQIYATESIVNNPTTPRPSTTITHEQSMLSAAGSPSRGPSQAGLEDTPDDGRRDTGSSHREPVSETESPQPRSISQLTSKTGEAGSKPNISHVTTVSERDVRSHHMDSARKSEATPVDAKKSSSFISNRSVATEGAQLMQSMISMGQSEFAAGSEEEEVEEEMEEEELDEETRQFNVWTHQINIFFVRKFFPAAQALIYLKQLVKSKSIQPDEDCSKASSEIARAPSEAMASHASETPQIPTEI